MNYQTSLAEGRFAFRVRSRDIFRECSIVERHIFGVEYVTWQQQSRPKVQQQF